NLIPEVGQGAYYPVIAPVPVLDGHTNNQLLDLAVDPRPARASTSLQAVEFAGDKLAIPGKDGVRPGDGCDLGENRTPEPMTDLAERGSIGVRQLQPALQLGLQDAVFGGQIFITRQQLLVDRPGNAGQHARPIHTAPLPPQHQPATPPSITLKC